MNSIDRNNISEEDFLEIYGAKENNLKDISLKIPRNKLVVVTGLSGSGKSSLAFDTLFAEGQRRYIETFSAYARNFLGGMQRPDVDKVTGLSPVISIEQKTTNKNPRSTVGTITEVYDYLRLLFARAGEAYSYVMACSSTQFVANGALVGQYGNHAVLTRACHEMGVSSISVSIDAKYFTDTTIDSITEGAQDTYTVVFTVIPALAIFVTGIVIMVRRRYR